MMPCLIKAPTRSAIYETTRKKNNKENKNKDFTAKTEYLSLKAPSNTFKIHSDKTLAK